MPTTVRAVFLEDDASDRRRYAQRLTHSRSLDVRPLEFRGDGSEVSEILKAGPDVVLLDYELIIGRPENRVQPGRGSTFAALLREKLPDKPIVLVTRGSLIESAAFGSAIDLSAAFDEVVRKDHISNNPQQVRETLISLVTGFHILASKRRRDWKSLLAIVGAREDEEDLVQRASPPILPVSDREWRTSELARWIRKILLGYPGILYSALFVSTALGLSVKSFASHPVQAYFVEAKYTRPFQPPGGAWWKGRVLDLAYSLLEKAQIPPTQYTEFGAAWSKLKRSHLSRSTCLWSKKPGADCVCYLEQQPVLRQFSLPYRPDSRPDVMDEARVSFKAIRESEKFDEELVAPDSRHLVRGIQRGATSR